MFYRYEGITLKTCERTIMEVFVILWVLCAGLSYFIARDRVPEKAPLATFLGFALGPIGVAITFLLKPNTRGGEEPPTNSNSISPTDINIEFEKLSATEQHSRISNILNNRSAKSTDELKKELERMKTNLSKI